MLELNVINIEQNKINWQSKFEEYEKRMEEEKEKVQ
jgi:hypothetical protein